MNDPEYLCFDVDQQARVYVLYDQRAHKNAVAKAVAGGADPLTLDTRLGYPSWLLDQVCFFFYIPSTLSLRRASCSPFDSLP